MSSRGGCHSFVPFSNRFIFRDQGLCLHGNTRRRSLWMTYELETLKWCLSSDTGINPASCTNVVSTLMRYMRTKRCAHFVGRSSGPLGQHSGRVAYPAALLHHRSPTRKSQEHAVDNHGRTGVWVAVDRTGSVVVARSSTSEHFGSDTLGGVTVVAGERMFQRNAYIRAVSPAWTAVLVCTWDVSGQGGEVGVGTCSSLVAETP